jgi:GPH family glycoside/pentoside/hexuronide:cation symporter
MQPAESVGIPRLKTRTLFLYGLPNLSISIAQLPIGLYLNDLYTTMLGVPLGLVGLAIFLSRITDVITDPIVGSLSDNWKAPFGRRKFWLIVGTPLMVISLWLLFVPPPGVGAWWLFVMVSLFYLSNTMIDLPYRAWGADLSTDYRERSRIAGVREIYGLFGNVLVFLIPIGVGAFLGLSGIQDWTRAIAAFTAVALPIFILIAVLSVHEPDREEIHAERVNWRTGLALVARNGSFMRLALMGFIFTLTVGVTTATSLYFVDHIMGVRALYPYVLLAYFLVSIAAVPIWIRISHAVGKHRAVALAILWFAIGSAPMPFIEGDQFWVFVAFMMVKGSAIGALLFIPPSMAADVVDLDTLESGRQRTGLFFAFWGMILKFAAGVALLVTGIVGLLGFESGLASPNKAASLLRQEALAIVRAENPGVPVRDLQAKIAVAQKEAVTPDRIAAIENREQAALDRLAANKVIVEARANSPQALFSLALFYSWIPALLSLIALPFMWSYPLTEARQKSLRAEIAERRLKANLG